MTREMSTAAGSRIPSIIAGGVVVIAGGVTVGSGWLALVKVTAPIHQAVATLIVVGGLLLMLVGAGAILSDRAARRGQKIARTFARFFRRLFPSQKRVRGKTHADCEYLRPQHLFESLPRQWTAPVAGGGTLADCSRGNRQDNQASNDRAPT